MLFVGVRLPPVATVWRWALASATVAFLLLLSEVFRSPPVLASLRIEFPSRLGGDDDREGGDYSLYALQGFSVYAGRLLWPRYSALFLHTFATLVMLVYGAQAGPLGAWLRSLGLGFLLDGTGGALEPAPVVDLAEELADLPELDRPPGLGGGALEEDDTFDPRAPTGSKAERAGAHAFDPVVGLVPREVYDRWRENEAGRATADRVTEGRLGRGSTGGGGDGVRQRPPVRRPPATLTTRANGLVAAPLTSIPPAGSSTEIQTGKACSSAGTGALSDGPSLASEGEPPSEVTRESLR